MTVFSGHHFGRINRKLFSNSLPKRRSRLKYLSGVRAKGLVYYVTPTLKEEKPDIVIVRVNVGPCSLLSCKT